MLEAVVKRYLSPPQKRGSEATAEVMGSWIPASAVMTRWSL
jgi:hypothetical protein